ncbi:cytochrome P450 [Flagelloscypha sp. PMI_526]|nr:cytochrome P450 [Flagelloscypha sp. PMI_526]
MMFPSPSIAAAAIALSLVAYVLFRAISNLYFSPLSDIPGPRLAAISDIWLSFHALKLSQCRDIQSLFEQYGPVVRIGPNKVAFNNMAAARNIYSKEFSKSAYYKSMQMEGNNHAMTTLDHQEHSQRKKGYAPHYVTSHLAQFQPEMHDFAKELVAALKSIAGTRPLDCLSLFRQVMVDTTVALSYGIRIGAISKWAMDFEDPLSTAINDFPKRGILRAILPSWLWKLVTMIPNQRWKAFCDADKIMADFVKDRVHSTRTQMYAGKLVESEKMSLLQRLLSHRYNKDTPMPDNDLIAECMGHLVAGSDTSSASLSYFCWELSRRPDIVQKLRSELDEVLHDETAVPDILSLQNLPYLNAFVKEGLRVYGSVPSLLERVVPDSYSKSGLLDDGFDLLGYSLPAGTIVGTQAWSAHRDSSVFPSPDTFLPDRWLLADEDRVRQMNQQLMPFGIGSRICGGHNVAQMMLRILTAVIVHSFDIEAPAETTERSMEMKDSFVMFPAAMECMLTFRPRTRL